MKLIIKTGPDGVKEVTQQFSRKGSRVADVQELAPALLRITEGLTRGQLMSFLEVRTNIPENVLRQTCELSQEEVVGYIWDTIFSSDLSASDKYIRLQTQEHRAGNSDGFRPEQVIQRYDDYMGWLRNSC